MRKSSLSLLFCGAVLFAFVSIPAWAGWMYNPNVPVDSAYWWTLTDEMTPEELKATLFDRNACLERYEAAFKAGLERAFSQEEIDSLSFYYHRKQTPELMPLWHAFSVWATRLEPGRSSWTEERALDELYRYDISASGAEQLIVYAAKYRAEKAAVIDEVMHDQQEFADLQLAYLYPMGYTGAEKPSKQLEATWEKAIVEQDYAFFARLSGESEERMEELMRAWWTSPSAHASSANLPPMKADLTREDWENFRRFLLLERASKMGSLTEFSAALEVKE